ncbi:MAG: hypothetical protein IV092_21010 [Burkholderiaceae bacterium]|nr:hypothetical protein [Burkholderiaceae bacterium]
MSIKQSNKGARLALIFTLLAALNACGGGGATDPAPPPTPPASLAIPNPMQSTSAYLGSTQTFSVVATGVQPITYQWKRNGADIAGAIGASYTPPPLSQNEEVYEYQVVVSNPSGTITSDIVRLYALPTAPRIKTQTNAIDTADGNSVELLVTAIGTEPMLYQWKRNGVAIPNAVTPNHAFTAAQANSGDIFSLSISNSVGTTDSAPIRVGVTPAPIAFSEHPQPVSASPGGSVIFSAKVQGNGTFTYQWQRSMNEGASWDAIAGATDRTYRIENTTLADAAAQFKLQATGPSSSAFSQVARLTVTPDIRLLAGSLGGSGHAEGRGDQARFELPLAVAIGPDGAIYVAENSANDIRRIGPSGDTSTFAGARHKWEAVDGKRLDARFNAIQALAFDSQGTLWVAEDCLIRKISPAGDVSTVAGSQLNCRKSADGQGQLASFSRITGLVATASGDLYATDEGSHTIRKISAAGMVTTIAGSPNQAGTADGIGAAARFSYLAAITADRSGNLFVIDGNAIRRISPSAEVTRFAGSPLDSGSSVGDRLTSARFANPRGLAFDLSGNLYVTEYERIARIEPSGTVSTFAGRGAGAASPSIDGTGSAAGIRGAFGIALQPDGRLAFASYNCVRVLDSSAKVITLAGLPESFSTQDGPGAVSRFYGPQGMSVDSSGAVSIADTGAGRIRRMDPNGMVSTIPTRANGAEAASITRPETVMAGPDGSLYVAGQHAIRKFSPEGILSLLAGKADDLGLTDGPGLDARFNGPLGLAIDRQGNLFVADTGNHRIRKISPAGVVTTAAGSNWGGIVKDGPALAATLQSPSGLAFDSKGNLYISDTRSHTIRRLSTDGAISTFAGMANMEGDRDGAGAVARFSYPNALAFDSRDNLYVADTRNHTIRRITPGGHVSTVIGSSGRAVVRFGPAGSINTPSGIAVLPNGRLVFSSEQAILSD